jgi:Domain of unknown function (DUF397)
MKSSFCESGECVDVDAFQVDGDQKVQVRNSSFAHFTSIFDRSEWDAFIKGVKAGEFDWEVLF